MPGQERLEGAREVVGEQRGQGRAEGRAGRGGAFVRGRPRPGALLLVGADERTLVDRRVALDVLGDRARDLVDDPERVGRRGGAPAGIRRGVGVEEPGPDLVELFGEDRDEQRRGAGRVVVEGNPVDPGATRDLDHGEVADVVLRGEFEHGGAQRARVRTVRRSTTPPGELSPRGYAARRTLGNMCRLASERFVSYDETFVRGVDQLLRFLFVPTGTHSTTQEIPVPERLFTARRDVDYRHVASALCR
ncbi:hypothetical protein GCM10025864_19000 [Luteimicrobium album]|uniref:Uncharacterized protein n=1 Tax=Luteimicrobium album TaxID=1054550 RepID=A0ABQ6I0C5_9MICO|nr:hypothetical protein GCM10025864_19000 [Luteimicrobium album]